MSLTGLIQFIARSVALAAAFGTIAGCAATSSYPDEIAVKPGEAQAALARTTNRVIAIRYPAIVERDARESYEDNFMRRVVDQVGSFWGKLNKGENAGAAGLLEMSSAYHGAQLLLAIKRIDPTLLVLLEPHAISTEQGHRLKSTPLTDSRPFADVSPYLWSFHWAESGLSSAQFYLTIQTSPRRSPGNCGLLFTKMFNEPLKADHRPELCRDDSHGNAWISSFLLDGKHRRDTEVFGKFRESLPLNSSETVVTKALGTKGMLTAITATATATERAAEAGVSDLSSFKVEPMLEELAQVIATSLAVPSAADGRSLAAYVADFDLELGQALASGRSLSASEQMNLTLLKRIAAQELKVRALRDETIAREILLGKFGKAYVEARTKARSESAAYFWRIVGTGALSVATMANAMQAGLSTAAAPAFVAQYTSSLNADYARDYAGYLRTVAPSINQVSTATLDMLDKEVSVNIGDQASLRAELRKLYLSRRTLP